MSWSLVSSFGSATRSGDESLDVLPRLFKKLIAEEAWRDFTTPRGEEVHYERFTDFLTTPPTKGAGCSVDLLRRLLRDDVEALNLLDQELAGGQGSRSDLGNNVPEVSRPEGNTRDKALRRLRKDRPDLLEQVLAEKMSAHAAMVEAGFRPRTATVRLDNPESIAATLRSKLTPDQVAELAALLTESGG